MQPLLSSLTAIPTEVIYEICSSLSQPDLKSLRLVCIRLGAVVRALLFKSVSISFLPTDVSRFLSLARDPELCLIVEELIFKEVHFQGDPTGIDDFQHVIYSYLAEPGLPRDIPMNNFLRERDYQDNNYLEVSFMSRGDIDAMFSRLKTDYEQQQLIVHQEDDFVALKEAFSTMRNLKRLISKDSRAPGILQDTIFQPPTLDRIGLPFPVSDATYRLLTFREASTCPDHGFFTFL